MNKAEKEKLIVIIGIFAAIIFIIVEISKISWIVDCTAWNNGYCDCGGKWTYQQAVGHQYTTGYLYECDKCGKTKEFDKKR